MKTVACGVVSAHYTKPTPHLIPNLLVCLYAKLKEPMRMSVVIARICDDDAREREEAIDDVTPLDTRF